MTAAGRDGGGPHEPERDERVTLPQTERLGRRGRGPVLVAMLVVAAFGMGVVRPWDWLEPGPPAPAAGDEGGADSEAGSPRAGASRIPAASLQPAEGHSGDAGSPSGAAAPFVDPTCAYPRSWRLAAIQDWGGRTARVWAAADAVAADGPGDPAIPFATIASTSVTAVGWCAPVAGPERPPLTAGGTLFRLDPGGPRELVHDRLEPASPDALGELWMPVPQSIGRRPPWPPGRYVIRLAEADGSYVRYLGIEVVRVDRAASPGGSPAPSASASPLVPGASPAPSAPAGASPGGSAGAPAAGPAASP